MNISSKIGSLCKKSESGKTLIKICGMTTPDDMGYANLYMPDLIGCVMYFPKSKRYISPERAKDLLDRLSPHILSVAVTVSPTPDQVKTIEDLGFDMIQVHGVLTDEVYDMASIPIFRAFNVSDLDEYDRIRQLEKIAGYVFDSKSPGSGKTFDWNLLKRIDRDDKLWFLAGGINEKNVREAIDCTRPDGIDVSSAVEWDDGIHHGKDPEKIKNIIRMVHNEE
ncbi:MAG: phosphoribosylanthranilate isomerase [Eubacterium sp.]|nr:phosphoribosylanthranilate isomerase [Eubacterium sp.]